MKGPAFLCWLPLVFLNTVLAQPGVLPLNRDIDAYGVTLAADTCFNYHPSLRPYLLNEGFPAEAYGQRFSIHADSVVRNRLTVLSLMNMQRGKFAVSADPIVQAVTGLGQANDSSDKFYEMGGGLSVKGFHGKKFAFGFDYQYYRASFTDYVQKYAEDNDAVPGLGRAAFSGNAIESQIYSGYLSWSPDSALNLQIGIGKHFLGHGYRSLLLSDNSFVYPYGRIQLNIWKIKYQVLYSGYSDIRFGTTDTWRVPDKYATSNYLSVNIGRHAQIGLFQAVVWQRKDSLHERGFDINYLNPVIFTRPVEYSVGSPDNAILGIDFSYKLFRKNILYFQAVLDEFLLDSIQSGNGWWANKYGYQVGLRICEPFRLQGVTVLLERNEVRPYTYAHSEIGQNYGHYNQPLAHTLGANFEEYVVRLSYCRHRWLFQLNFMQAVKGNDYGGVNYGGDIYKSTRSIRGVSGNFTTQGNRTQTAYLEFRTSYLINPAWRLLLDAGFTHRTSRPEFGPAESSDMFHIGVRTALYNQYRDF